MGAVGEDGVEGRAGEGGAELLLGHVAEGVVVAVEEPAEVGMEGLVGGDELAEDEGLEEPAGVGEVPFDWAGLGTGLDHDVFGGEGSTEIARGWRDGLVAGEEELAVAWGRDGWSRQAWMRCHDGTRFNGMRCSVAGCWCSEGTAKFANGCRYSVRGYVRRIGVGRAAIKRGSALSRRARA